jgi:branched-chain amino acid transport system permease protein
VNHLSALLGGLAVGGSYSLVAVGVSLAFATTGVLSFAHAAFAMWASYLYAWLAGEHGVPVGWAAVVAVATACLIGLATERLVIRRVATASPVTRMIASLGVLSFFQGVILQVFGFYPKAAPALFEGGRVGAGDISLNYQQLAILVSAVALVLVLGGFLRFTRTGLAIRATAAQPTVARLLGARRITVARVNWAAGAAMAGVAGVLIAPVSLVSVGTFPILLTKALAATLFGGVVGMGGAFAGGLVIGAVEGLAGSLSGAAGARELGVLAVVVILLLTRRRWPADVTGGGPISTGNAGKAVVGSGWWLPLRVTLAGLTVALVVRGFGSGLWAYITGLAVVTALLGLSLVVLTGWSGQVSLMQGALAGVGAFGLIWLANQYDVPMALAMPGAVLLGAAVGGLTALAGSRLSGLQLGIATLAITAVASEYIFQIRGVRWSVERPTALHSDRALLAVMLVTLGVAVALLAGLRRSPWGRAMVALRTSPAAAAHFGVHPHRLRMLAFAVSGALAATAGVYQALLVGAITPTDFGPLLSISAVVFFVVGGRDSLAGPLIAALIFVAGPQVFKLSQTTASAIPDLLSGMLVVGLVAARPAGLADFLRRPVHEPATPSLAPVALRRSATPGRLGRPVPEAVA